MWKLKSTNNPSGQPINLFQQAVKYSSSLDAARQIVAKEGSKSLFKGAGANILRGVAGAGVLSIYDQVQLILFGKKYK